jgi:hypothetical protein
MESYVDTLLFEANRKTSPQYLSATTTKLRETSKNSWTNDCGSGIKLEIGDKISLHSAYVSQVGNEAATIEIKGEPARNNLNEGQMYNSSDTTYTKVENTPLQGDMKWTYTPTSQNNLITDDSIKLTHSFYKTTNGEYYITLPRHSAVKNNLAFNESSLYWTSYNSSENGAVAGQNPYRFERDYTYAVYRGEATGGGNNVLANTTHGTARREICNDGSRYTLFTRPEIFNYAGGGDLDGHRDPALADYNWYKRTYSYDIKTGFNNPENVATSFTNQMGDIREIDQYELIDAAERDTLNRRFDIVAKTRVNEPFPCAFGEGFNDENALNYLSYRNQIFPVTYQKTSSVAEANGGDYRNYIQLTSAADLQVGMWCVATNSAMSPSPIGRRIVYIHPAGAGITYPFVYFDGEINTYSAGETFDFSMAGSPAGTGNTYDYYYQSCYATIGYKRPEIQEAGRNIDTNDSVGLELTDEHTIDGSWLNQVEITDPLSDTANLVPNMFPSSIPWTDDNLLKLKELFSAQKKYPELFSASTDYTTAQEDYIGASATPSEWDGNVRFLHLNASNTETITITAVAGTTSGSNVLSESTNTGTTTIPMKMVYDDSAAFVGDTYIASDHAGTLYLTSDATLTSGVSNTFRFTNHKLGNDQYFTPIVAKDTNFPDSATLFDGSNAPAFFIDFNKDRENLNEGFGEEPRFDNLRYGFAIRYESGGSYYIGFWTGETAGAGGFNTDWFNGNATIPALSRCIGFDKHFNAFSTASLMLYNGIAGRYGNNYNSTSDPNITEFTTYQDRGDVDGIPSHTDSGGNVIKVFPYTPTIGNGNFLMNEIYIGANDPALTFDGTQSRFQFTRLHTPEIVGTNASTTASGLNVDDAKAICYKINKRLSRLNFSPNFIPYNNPIVSRSAPASPYPIDLIKLDMNIIPYSIMDATSGIFIEDYGCDEENWNKSLWFLMGFSYQQFHNTEDNRLVRVNNVGLTTSTPTTNALMEASDLTNFTTLNGIPTYQPEKIPYPKWFYEYVAYTWAGATPNAFAMNGYQDFPEIVQNCSSVSITADNLPRKMLSPIYLVKTDLLSPYYVGGQKGTSSLPVISVVPKTNGYGDFYSGEGSEIFTNTIPRTIQNIKTEIVDADGSPSRVDDGCCVIYKIQKNINSNANVLQNILNPQTTQKK